MLCADELELGCAGEPAVLALAIARDVQEADQPLAWKAAAAILMSLRREKGPAALAQAEMNARFERYRCPAAASPERVP